VKRKCDREGERVREWETDRGGGRGKVRTHEREREREKHARTHKHKLTRQGQLSDESIHMESSSKRICTSTSQPSICERMDWVSAQARRTQRVIPTIKHVLFVCLWGGGGCWQAGRQDEEDWTRLWPDQRIAYMIYIDHHTYRHTDTHKVKGNGQHGQ